MKKRISLIYVILFFIFSIMISINSDNNQMSMNYLLYFIFINMILIFIYHINFNLLKIIMPLNVLMYFYIFFIFFGVIISGMYNDLLIVTNSLVSYITSCFSAIILAVFVGKIIYESNRDNKISIKNILENTNYIPNGLIFIVLGYCTFIFYYFSVGTIPLLMSGADDFRVEAIKGKGFIVLLGYALILNGLIFNYFYNKKNGRLRSSYILFFISTIIILGAGFRGNAFKILLVLIVLVIFSKYEKIKIVKTSFLISGLFALVAITGFFRSSGDVNVTLDMILRVTLWRFYVNVYNLQHLVNYVVTEGFLFGKTYLMDFMTILPGHQKSSSTYMKEIMGMEFSGGGITPTIFGESLINFGFVMGVVFIFMIFLILTLIQNNITGKIVGENGVLKLHLLVVIAYSVDPIIGSGLFPMLLYSVIPNLLIRYIMIIYYYKIKIK